MRFIFFRRVAAFICAGRSQPVGGLYSPFSSTFAAGETLTFTLAAGGGGVARGFAEDTTAAVKILDAIMETSASYTIPAGGARSFNLELDADDFDASISVSCAPSPQTGSITISKNSGGIDGDFNFTGDLGAFSVSVAGEPSPQTFSALAAGVYTVIETWRRAALQSTSTPAKTSSAHSRMRNPPCRRG